MTFVPYRVQLNEAQDEIMKKKELLEDLQPDNTQTCKTSPVRRLPGLVRNVSKLFFFSFFLTVKP